MYPTLTRAVTTELNRKVKNTDLAAKHL